MPLHSVKNALAFSVACALALVLSPRALDPFHDRSSDIGDLFDPVAMARSMCGHTAKPTARTVHLQLAEDTKPAPVVEKRLWSGLGNHGYKITTSQPEAQQYFDQCLRLFYAFNFGEAVASFRAASQIDP